MSATIELDAAGTLVRFSASGVLVEEARNALLWKAVREHPECQDSDAEIWLTGAGGEATIGRSAPAPASLGAAPWGRFLGTSVTAESSRFRWRGDAPPGTPPGRVGPDLRVSGRMPDGAQPPTVAPPALGVRPAWVVEATAMGATGDPCATASSTNPLVDV